jgi:hypothetical protein
MLQVRRIYQELWTAYPDYSVHVEDVLARDDSHTVAVHFTATGARLAAAYLPLASLPACPRHARVKHPCVTGQPCS